MSEKNNTGTDQNATKGGTDPTATQPQGASGGNAGQQTTPSTDKKMGLEMFLQKIPQPSGITTLLRLKHKADVKTQPEWEALVKEFLKTKVQ